MEIITFDEAELDETFSEEGELAPGEPYIDKTAVIFRAGHWKGKNYTTADLDRAVSAFKEPSGPTEWDVPVQVDHEPASSTRTCGWLRKVWRDGNLLRATMRFSGAEAVSNVRGARWKKLSSGFRSNGSLHHVAVTPYPHVLGSQVFHEEEQTMEKPADTGTQPPATAPAAADNSVTMFAEMQAKLEAQFAENTKKLEAQFSERLKSMEETIDAQKAVIRFQELTGLVDKFSEAVKIAPAARGAELELVKTFSDEQLELWKKAREASPSYVEFGIRGTQEFSEDGGGAGKDNSESLREKYPQPKGGK